MPHLSRSVPIAFLLVATATACAKKSAPAPAPAPEPAATPAPPPSGPSEDELRAQREREARERAERERAAHLESMRNTMNARIYFEFDRDDLTAEARNTLDQKLAVMNQAPGVKIRIAGNADERGSDEYNLALGQRRAAAAKRYLTQHGIDVGRIDVVSYGEERPVCGEHVESCWSQNRRDDFEITVAGEMAARP